MSSPAFRTGETCSRGPGIPSSRDDRVGPNWNGAPVTRVFVASVYAPCDRNSAWLGLQRRFLEETTCCHYDFGVWLNRTDEALFRESGVHILGRSDDAHGDMCHE